MGLEIKKNEKGKYQMKSSISGEILHKGWITEDEVKKILIERTYWNFINQVIEIDMEFPNDYTIDGVRIWEKEKSGKAISFILEHLTNDTTDKIYEKGKEIIDRLKIKL
jgi:hypothetical protein